MTSGLRRGDKGYHGSGRAMDFSNAHGPSPEQLAFAQKMVTMFGSSLAELIYTPLGFSVRNGKRVPPYAQADHYDHVHVAFNKGGLVPGSGNQDTVPAMLTPGEFVLSKDMLKRMGSFHNAVQFFGKGGWVKSTGSYYGDGEKLADKTASGEKFNPNDMTAAHRKLPFGTRLEVRNPANGKTVVVRINDRGPFAKGRTIDLSRGAARAIGFNSGAIEYRKAGSGSTSSKDSTSSGPSGETPAERAKRKREEEEQKRTEGMTKWKELRDEKMKESRDRADQKTKETRIKRNSNLEIMGIEAGSDAVKRLIAIKQEDHEASDTLSDKLTEIARKRADLKAERAYKVKNKVKGGTDYSKALKLLDEEEGHEKRLASTAALTRQAKHRAELKQINLELAESYEGLVDKIDAANLSLLEGPYGEHLSALRAINKEHDETVEGLDKEIAKRQEILFLLDPKSKDYATVQAQLTDLEQQRAGVGSIRSGKTAAQQRSLKQT